MLSLPARQVVSDSGSHARSLPAAPISMINGFGEAPAIEKLRKEIAASHGVRVAYSGADLSKPAEVTGLIEKTTAELGRVDMLVNNAGIQHVAPVHEFPVERWDAVIAINLTAVFLAIRAALPQMLARDWGRIINIASVHGLVASVDKSAYVASKHGVVGLTKAVALETATMRHHLQRDLPRMGAHATGTETDRRPCGEGEAVAGRCKDQAARRKTALARVHHPGAARRARRVPLLGRRSAAQRCGAPGGWRMDRAIASCSTDCLTPDPVRIRCDDDR